MVKKFCSLSHFWGASLWDLHLQICSGLHTVLRFKCYLMSGRRYDTEQVWRYFSFYTTGQGTKWLYHICLVCELLSWDLLTRNIFGFRILIAVWNTLQSDLRSSYFTKGTNDLKESSTKEKTPISGLAFHTLARGVVLFVPSRSSRNHFLNGRNSSLRSFHFQGVFFRI